MNKFLVLIREEQDAELRKLKGEHGGRYTKTLLATTSAFALSCWLTAKGLFDKTIEAGVASAEGMITSGMTAAVAATALGAGTIMLLGVAKSAARKQWKNIAGLAAALIPFTLGISTYNAILGNAGPASLIYDMRDAAASHASYFEAMSSDASGAQSAMAALQPLQVSICNLAEAEGSKGVLTGAAGKKAVYAAYISSCSSLETIIQTLSETAVRTALRRELAAVVVEDLKMIPKESDKSVFDRQAEFRVKSGELLSLIEESNAENLSDRLMAQLEILEASVATLDVQEGDFGERQSAAIKSLKDSLGVVSETVGRLVRDSASRETVPPGELREMGAAVAAYWTRNIPQILMAIMIDFMALWFAGLLMVSRGTIEARRYEISQQADSSAVLDPRNRKRKSK